LPALLRPRRGDDLIRKLEAQVRLRIMEGPAQELGQEHAKGKHGGFGTGENLSSLKLRGKVLGDKQRRKKQGDQGQASLQAKVKIDVSASHMKHGELSETAHCQQRHGALPSETQAGVPLGERLWVPFPQPVPERSLRGVRLHEKVGVRVLRVGVTNQREEQRVPKLA